MAENPATGRPTPEPAAPLPAGAPARSSRDASAPPPGTPRPAQPPRAPIPEPLWREVLGERLRRLRHARGENLTETAGRAGVSPQYLSEIERGVKEPSSEMIAAVAGALDVGLLDLTGTISHDLRARRSATGRAAERTAYALAV